MFCQFLRKFAKFTILSFIKFRIWFTYKAYKMKKNILLLFFCYQIHASVPVFEPQDWQTITQYNASLAYYIGKLNNALTIADQIKNLKSIQQLSNISNNICQLCNEAEQQQLTDYVNQINDDLCSQFTYALQNISNIDSSINNIQDIINSFNTNPKAAALALQQSAISLQAQSQNTLSQMHLLLVTQQQKQLAEQKLEKQTNEDFYNGIQNSGL